MTKSVLRRAAPGRSRCSLLVAAAGLAFIACSGGGNGDDGGDVTGARSWECYESDACACRVNEPGTVFGGLGVRVDRCAAYGCCLLTEPPDANESQCDCFETDASCEAEAASRRDATVVAECPPPGEGPPPGECAAVGENCTADYLDQNALEGCCEGAVCATSAEGVRVCTSATPEEAALAEQCDRVARSSETQALAVTSTEVATNVGSFDLSEIALTLLSTGPGGCLNGLYMSFGDLLCGLDVSAEVSADRLAVTYVSARFSECPGFTGADATSGLASADDPAAIPFDLEFRGLSCDAHLVFEAYCLAGVFDWHLNGVIEGMEFADRHLIVEGVLCGSEPEAACPTP